MDFSAGRRGGGGGGPGDGREQANHWLEIAEKLLAARDLVDCKRFAERAVDSSSLLPTSSSPPSRSSHRASPTRSPSCSSRPGPAPTRPPSPAPSAALRSSSACATRTRAPRSRSVSSTTPTPSSPIRPAAHRLPPIK
ncbi:hypothetical protein BAE44_0013219 [Dichanthelium oligosanthes]|uniref:Uncharacterized protein n=1 Tax=Dichanthelium oligosanthes TaxID=888268 RepID=A0A1E5VL17_9POAL|nr:hypothetical protein BAE44_0013219 [Dichanthelium oligosanthes]